MERELLARAVDNLAGSILGAAMGLALMGAVLTWHWSWRLRTLVERLTEKKIDDTEPPY